jgi:hypothetical protein
MPSRPLLAAPLLAWALAASSTAEVHTLTDKQGRSIKADVISVENDTAKIRRDDGRSFELALSTLTDADQTKLRDWAKKQADKPLPAGAIGVVASRTKFDSKKTETTVPFIITYTDGTVKRETRIQVTVNEEWGYSLTVENRTLQPINGLRLEYKLFSAVDSRGPASSVSTLQIPPLKPRDKVILKTNTVTLTKTHLKGDSVKPVGNQLQGVWVRIYKGDDLVHESSTPENISMNNKW